MANRKIDDSILLELVVRKLTNSEIARYFGVQPSSVRSKIVSLERRSPEFANAIRLRSPKANALEGTLSDRLSGQTNAILADAAHIIRKVQVSPVPEAIAEQIQRADLLIKGLTILEKVQKLQTPSTREHPRTLQVGQITQIISGNRPAVTPEGTTQTIEA